jgi:hypothetical protein
LQVYFADLVQMVFCTGFFSYSTVHRHSGIGYHTPESVHYGLDAGIREQRAAVPEAAIAGVGLQNI